MDPKLYSSLNSAWKTTSRILFGTEVGEFSEFEPYLAEAAVGKSVSSCFSKEPVWVASPEYSNNARFFDYGKEQQSFAKITSNPFDINKIKDLDSLIEVTKDRFIYGGNKFAGTSSLIDQADSVVNSTAIYRSSMITQGKNMAYCFFMRVNESAFGCTSSGESSHIARCFYNNKLMRCFEVCTIATASDSYFCYNLFNSADCLFTFNVRSKRHMIGNIQLERDQYSKLKTKLIAEIADELKRKKRLDFSIIDFLNTERGADQ